MRLKQYNIETQLRIFLLVVSSIMATASIYAQPACRWAYLVGDYEDLNYLGYDVALDSTSNMLFATGYFSGTNDFNIDTAAVAVNSLTSYGSNDVYIGKYGTATGAYQTAWKIGGTGDDQARSIALDNSGNVYVIGYFNGTANFNPGGTATITSAGSSDVFVAKYNSSGTYQWAVNIGGAGADFGNDIAVDNKGHVYVIGTFSVIANFDPVGTYTLAPVGGNDAFVAKYSSSTGVFISAFNIGSTTADIGSGIALDTAGGRVYVTGSFTGTADFDPVGTATITASGSNETYLAAYDSLFAYQWSFKIGNTGDDGGRSVVVDVSGNISVTGYFSATVDFDPSGSAANITSAGLAGNQDSYVAQYTSAGAYRWAQKSGNSLSDVDVGYRVAVDLNKNVYASGTLALLTANSYLIKYNSAGTIQWTLSLAGSGNFPTDGNSGRGIATDKDTLYYTGYFNGSPYFDPTASTFQITSAPNGVGGYRKPFLARYGPAPALMPIELLSFSGKCQPTLDPSQKRITLDWATASETNNNYFSIERSNDPLSEAWENLGTVAGAGNSSTARTYEFIDNSEAGNHISQLLYYRLKQTDYDGKYEYFGPVAISPQCSKVWEFNIVNNIVINNEVNCTLSVPDDDVVQLQVFDISGQLLSSVLLNVTKGSNWFQLNVSQLAAGTYFIKASNGEKYLHSKFVKLQ